MFLLTIIQVAFISGLPEWFSNINAVLVVLIMILGFGSFGNALVWAIAVGVLLDMYSFSTFGLNIVSLVGVLFLTNFLLKNVLTNRSLYTFVLLTLLASVIFELLNFIITYVYTSLFRQSFLFSFPSNFWFDELLKIIANVVLSFVLFYIISYFSKRFKPMFLIR